MTGADEAGFLVVGTVRRPHGIRGELVVGLETDRPRAVFRPGRALLLGDGAGRPVGGALTVEKARPFKDGLLLKVVEHTGRSAELEALRGRSLLIPVTEAAPAGDDEVHYRDLVGMTMTVEGQPIGRVRRVAETPAGELLEVERPGRRDLLVPFVKEWVRAIDREGATLDLVPPEGLLEL